VVRGRVWERAENKKGRDSAAEIVIVKINCAVKLDFLRKSKNVRYFMSFSSVFNLQLARTEESVWLFYATGAKRVSPRRDF
jgi:hypothetical protein